MLDVLTQTILIMGAIIVVGLLIMVRVERLSNLIALHVLGRHKWHQSPLKKEKLLLDDAQDVLLFSRSDK